MFTKLVSWSKSLLSSLSKLLQVGWLYPSTHLSTLSKAIEFASCIQSTHCFCCELDSYWLQTGSPCPFQSPVFWPPRHFRLIGCHSSLLPSCSFHLRSIYHILTHPCVDWSETPSSRPHLLHMSQAGHNELAEMSSHLCRSSAIAPDHLWRS